jgi:hypothetical protein
MWPASTSSRLRAPAADRAWKIGVGRESPAGCQSVGFATLLPSPLGVTRAGTIGEGRVSISESARNLTLRPRWHRGGEDVISSLVVVPGEAPSLLGRPAEIAVLRAGIVDVKEEPAGEAHWAVVGPQAQGSGGDQIGSRLARCRSHLSRALVWRVLDR